MGVGERDGCSYVPRSGPRCLWSFTSAGPRDVETEVTHVEVDHDKLEGTGVSVRSPEERPRADLVARDELAEGGEAIDFGGHL